MACLLRVFCRRAEGDCHKCPLRQNQDPALRLQGCVCPSLVSAFPPFLDQLEPALWRSGKVLEAEAYSLPTRNGDTEQLLCPGAPQGPLGFRIARSVASPVWLLSLSVMFSRFICVAMSATAFYGRVIFHPGMDCVYPPTHCGASKLFPPFASGNTASLSRYVRGVWSVGL